MPYVPFYKYFPELAEQETRTITLFRKSSSGLPAGEYAFTEMYCNEKGCDCRRVFFYVVFARKDVAAVIAYGWEDPEYYAEWMRDDSPDVIEELKGPSLNLASPQSKLAPAVLELLKEIVLTDTEFTTKVAKASSVWNTARASKAWTENAKFSTPTACATILRQKHKFYYQSLNTQELS